jgi:hypothetical protein
MFTLSKPALAALIGALYLLLFAVLGTDAQAQVRDDMTLLTQERCTTASWEASAGGGFGATIVSTLVWNPMSFVAGGVQNLTEQTDTGNDWTRMSQSIGAYPFLEFDPWEKRDKTFLIYATIDHASSLTAPFFEIGLSLNGAAPTSLSINHLVAGRVTKAQVPAEIITLSPLDRLTVRALAPLSGSSITLYSINIFAKEITGCLPYGNLQPSS